MAIKVTPCSAITDLMFASRELMVFAIDMRQKSKAWGAAAAASRE